MDAQNPAAVQEEVCVKPTPKPRARAACQKLPSCKDDAVAKCESRRRDLAYCAANQSENKENARRPCILGSTEYEEGGQYDVNHDAETEDDTTDDDAELTQIRSEADNCQVAVPVADVPDEGVQSWAADTGATYHVWSEDVPQTAVPENTEVTDAADVNDHNNELKSENPEEQTLDEEHQTKIVYRSARQIIKNLPRASKHERTAGHTSKGTAKMIHQQVDNRCSGGLLEALQNDYRIELFKLRHLRRSLIECEEVHGLRFSTVPVTQLPSVRSLLQRITEWHQAKQQADWDIQLAEQHGCIEATIREVILEEHKTRQRNNQLLDQKLADIVVLERALRPVVLQMAQDRTRMSHLDRLTSCTCPPSPDTTCVADTFESSAQIELEALWYLKHCLCPPTRHKPENSEYKCSGNQCRNST